MKLEVVTLCHFGGRPELWEPFYRELEAFGPDAPAVPQLSGKTLRCWAIGRV
jgi:hypothetical protein